MGGAPQKEIRTFGTMTEDLLELTDWLAAAGCTHVAMESTGVYWKPLYNLLEATFTPLLVNARHIKSVPGRKTDVKDCEWIADLLRHGLLRGSFVPERPQRELRELSRYRTTLVRERSAEVGRLQKTLEGANIKLASVATDIMGKSARQMLKALIDGSTDTSAMAQNWLEGSCGRRSRNWSGLCRDVPERTSASSLPNNWPTSTFSMRP
jgi:transposase